MFLVFFVTSFVSQSFSDLFAIRFKQNFAIENAHVIDANTSNDSFNDQLVFLSGKVYAPEPLTDQEFSVSSEGIILLRRVEVFQWEEDIDRSNASTSYTYEHVWSDELIDSTRFRKDGYDNPSQKPYASKYFINTSVTVGPHKVDQSLLETLIGSQNFQSALSDDELDLIIETKLQNYTRSHGFLWSGNPEAPEVGDVRISFGRIMADALTIVAKKSDNEFLPFETKKGPIFIAQQGIVDLEHVFDQRYRQAFGSAVIIVVTGYLFIWVGIVVMLEPLRGFPITKSPSRGLNKMAFKSMLAVSPLAIGYICLLFIIAYF
ncbi:TMEM43 family protein [Kordiimonas sp. SCSIO 12610]|uniref:TMEM43 family protein n=1 Tax=Kordiimonas sp. SCSIO 12610 TaxID=2829597 RepID=UPI00210C8685|nr:TMEM43 family protein [Kordiimonas sp. SCSIO 12610]UTW56353.1 hypothetical protein KFF44_05475 [Kordiimonas sp. SCSIO 12610]